MRHMNRLALVLATFPVLASAAHAATVTLTATDAAGQSSFASGLHWSDATAPSSANDYLANNGFGVRTVADSAGTTTFAGNSLTLGDGTTAGILTFKNAATGATVVVNNLTLNNGELQAGGTGSGAANITTVGGGITLGATASRFNTGTTGRGLIISAPIGGSGAVSVINNGSIAYTGTNTYTGATTITGTTTTLNIGNGGTTGTAGTGTITVSTTGAGGLVFNRSDTITQGTDFGGLAGAGTISFVGGGTVIVNQANANTGVNSVGAVNGLNTAARLSGSGTLGTGAINVLGNGTAATSAGGRLELAGASVANAVTLSGKAFAGVAGVESVSGANTISGALGLTTGGNNYALQADAGSTLALTSTTAITIANGATSRLLYLQGDGNGSVAASINSAAAAGANVGTGALVKAGNGTWTLSAANAILGGTTINAGTLAVTADGGLGSSAVTVTAGQLTLSGGTNFIGDAANLSLASGALANLNFTGTDTIGQLVLGGTPVSQTGTYGAVGSGATYQSAFLTGTGLLNVTATPEPASLAVLGLAAVGLVRRRRA